MKELWKLSSNFNTMANLIEEHVDNLSRSEERFRTIAEYFSDMISMIAMDTKQEAKKVAEEIREAIEGLATPHISSGVKPYVTISAGVHTIIPTVEKHPLEFLKEIDQALYTAKHSGRNNVQVFDDEKVVNK